MDKKAEARVMQLRQQSQYTCMATSLSSALAAHGKQVSEEEVNRVLGATAMRGASWEEALAVLQYFGLRGHLVVPATIEMLRRWTDRGIPVLIGWNPEDRPWAHASVVFKVDDADQVYVMDPNIPDPSQTTRVVSRTDFYKRWAEKWNDKLIVRRPALAVTKEVDKKGRQVMASDNNIKKAYCKGMTHREFGARLAKLSPEFIENYKNPPPEVVKVRNKMVSDKDKEGMGEGEFDLFDEAPEPEDLMPLEDMQRSLMAKATPDKNYVKHILASNKIPYKSIMRRQGSTVVGFSSRGDYYSGLSLIEDLVPEAQGNHRSLEISVPI